MRIPGTKTLKQSARWLKSRFVDNALILGYHRIADEPYDPYRMLIKPEFFGEQVEILRHYCNPVSLDDLLQGLIDGKLPRRAVAITFDDGYADNLYLAKPLLEKFGIPATLFVSTGYLGSTFWWDELAGIFQSMSGIPDGFDLSVQGRIFQWKPCNSDGVQQRNDTLRSLWGLHRSLYFFLSDLSIEERQNALAQIFSLAEDVENSGQPPRALSTKELVQLVKGGLFAVGAHTVNHPGLADLSENDQWFEILHSKICLEDILDKPVSSFSYPNGRLSDVTQNIVKSAGYRCACTSENDVVWSGSDPFRLPRFWVPNWNGAAFSKWLFNWLGN